MKNPTKAVFFNAPPQAGKDTAAKEVVALLNVSAVHNVRAYPLKFSQPLKLAVHALFGISSRNPDLFEDVKEEPNNLLHGAVPRTAYQKMAEAHAKIEYGHDIFGQIFLRNLKETEKMIEAEKHSMVVVCADSGFPQEIAPVIEYLGAENCLMVQIEREGCSFKSDTRGTVELDGVKTITIENNEGLAEFKIKVIETVANWLNAK